MPLIMQLERHLTNQGIIFISTPLIMLFFGQSPEQSTHCISGASLCPIIWLFLLLGASGHGGSKRKRFLSLHVQSARLLFASEPNLPLSRCGQICRSFSRILISYGWRPALEMNSWWTIVFSGGISLVISFWMKFYTSMKLSCGELEGFGEFKNWI